MHPIGSLGLGLIVGVIITICTGSPMDTVNYALAGIGVVIFFTDTRTVEYINCKLGNKTEEA